MIDKFDNRTRRDPAREFNDAPPNFGQYNVPQIFTFSGLVSSISKTYKNPDEAIKHSLDNARYMRNDIGIQECIESRQRATAMLDWHIEVDGPDMPAHKALADKLTGIMKKIPRFTEYRRCLLEAIWYGRHAIQHQFGWNIKPDGREIVVKEWMPINGDKLAFRYDDGSEDHPRNEVGVRVGAGFKANDLVRGRVVVPCIDGGMATFLSPAERALITLHKHMVEDAAFEDPLGAGSIHGIGIRSRIYWEWFQKQELLALFVEYLERSALGFEIWYYEASNPASFNDTKTAAENRNGRKNIILVPRPIGDDAHQYGVERVEPGASGAGAFQDWLTNYHGHRIKRYILGQTLTSEADATGLGSGLAELHLQTMLDIVKYDATNLEESITTQTLHQSKLVNCPEAHGVDVRFVIQTQSPDTESKLKAFESAWNMGARLKESDVMDAIGASVPESGEPFLQNAQAGRQEGAPAADEGSTATQVSMSGLGDKFKQALNVGGHGDALDAVQQHLGQHGGDEHATHLRATMGFASKIGEVFGDVERNRLERYAFDESKVNRDDDGQFSGKDGGGEKPAKVHKDKKRRTIQEAAEQLASKGYEVLGGLPYDMEKKTAQYRVKLPNGNTAAMTPDDINQIIDGGDHVEQSNGVRIHEPDRNRLEEPARYRAAPESPNRMRRYEPRWQYANN